MRVVDDRRGFWPKPVTAISRWAAWCGGGIILLSAFLVTLDVIIRELANRALLSSFELSSYGFAIAVALGLSYSLVTGAHIRIDLIDRLRPVAVRGIAGLLASLSMLLFAAALAYYGFLTLSDSIAYGVRSNSTLALPLAAPQALWFLGLTAFAAIACYGFGRTAYLLATGRQWRASQPAAGSADPPATGGGDGG